MNAAGESFNALDWIAAIGSLITAIMAISAYLNSRRELRLAQTPRLLVQLVNSSIKYGHVIPGTSITGISQLVFNTLVRNLGSNIIDLWITIDFVMPDGVRKQASGWYGANHKQLGPGEEFVGVIEWSVHFADIDIDRYHRRYVESKDTADRYILILVKSFAQDSTDHTIFTINPERDYLFDFRAGRLIQYP